jgi:hypothetical protein
VKRVAILQPGYLPWLGFFDQADSVDLFVLYDNVQYTKQDWRNRNRIKTQSGVDWLTVPVQKFASEARINEVRIAQDGKWAKKHLNLIQNAYRKAPHFEGVWGELEKLLMSPRDLLQDLDHALASWMASKMGIRCEWKWAHEIPTTSEEKSEKLLQICKSVGANEFIDGAAAESFLKVESFHEAGITIQFQEYQHPVYPQLWGEFQPYLSALDLMFNCGPESLAVIRSGRRFRKGN